ncbi:MAG: SRPBCC family protein [Acidimicrobiales bacterium]
MELTNEFEVAVPVEEAWTLLTDVERIAPCLPGAELQEVEGDEYRGVVKVKVGPITASYKGSARFQELDGIAHRGVLRAEGRETRGQGNASATITATLSSSGTGTKVEVVTDLAITGKVAQFGRGVLADVSGKLLDQFVRNLETMVLAPDAPDAPASGGKAAAPGRAPAAPRRQASPDEEATAGGDAAQGASATPATKAPVSRSGESSVASNGAAPDASAAPSAPAHAGGSHAGTSATSTPGAGTSATGRPVTGTPAASADEPAPSPIRRIQSAPAEPVDLGRIAGPSLARRLIPFASAAGALFLVRVIVYALRRRKK